MTLRRDLHTTRHALLAGTHSAADAWSQSLDTARSVACAHVFIGPDFQVFPTRPPHAWQALAGLAVSVKDLFDVAGQTTAAGSMVLVDAPPAAHDAPAVGRMKAAGGVLLGRTNMSEFAFSGVGTNPHHGTPVNPCDATTPRIPGGSSSGAAVSVATGAAFVGLGSDTGGSIRIPAALCGVVGFKSTARLVPTDGALPLSTTLDTVCAITRSVTDAITVHEVLAKRQVTRSRAPLAAYRLAVDTDFMLAGLDETVARAFTRTLARLRAAGARIHEVQVTALRQQPDGGFAAPEAFAWHREMLVAHGARYDPRVRLRIEKGAPVMAWEYLDLLDARAQWTAQMGAQLQGFDAVLSPTVPMVAPPIADVAPAVGRNAAPDAQREAEFFRVNNLLLRNTSAVNLLDGCGISIPCHAADELPVGLMIWNGALRDDTVLNVAVQAETALS